MALSFLAEEALLRVEEKEEEARSKIVTIDNDKNVSINISSNVFTFKSYFACRKCTIDNSSIGMHSRTLHQSSYFISHINNCLLAYKMFSLLC